ncbi:hypothetical protein [Cohnella zeiphila]|uniref:Uncharacterized protein n=1 Tax=Cohnella zeiphila TaxID=2761120 RepID=A0A7X0SKW6_9BACL|nr:hypothetical protein [Cohnella zeiphila]MBB6731882.1 hypothetical protein [Cohnella zeiphila]
MAISSTIQAELQRKAAAGIPLTNPTAETTAAYNAAKAKLAPVNNTTTNTNNVAVKPAPTAPIANAATGGTASATGYGGATYGTNGATNAAILANQNKLATDKNFLQSEIDRTLQTIKDREAQGLDTSAQYKYLNQNLGYNNTTGTGVGSLNGTNIFNPGSYGGYDPTAEEQAYLANQIAAYNGQSDAAKLAAQYGIDQNNAALNEQLDKLNQQKAVDTNAAQELQNRRGGFYSGGLDTQLASIDSGYANNVNTLTRDVASRNQQLLDQYGNMANTIAEQINNLQQNAPDILRSRIQDWINNERNYGLDYANTFGSLNGKQTLGAEEQQFNQDLANRQQDLNERQQDLTETQVMAELTGKLPDGTPTNQYQQQQLENYWTVADQTGVIPNVLADMYGLPHGTSTFEAKQAAIQNAQQQQQIGISAQNARTSSASAANSASNARFNQLMDVWQATGKAPAGLEQYGIQAGQALPTESKPTPQSSLSNKQSTDNLNQILDDLSDPNITKAEARQLLNANAANLTDSDYKKLSDEINSRTFKQ